MPTFHLIIKGKVQGVFYRAGAKKMAERTGITGWVKNTYEGNVEAMISGNNEQLQLFISWCKKGPEKANVDDVFITQKEDILFDNFEIV